MAAKFDNVDDLNSKFTGTICYYDKKPVIVKSVSVNVEGLGEGYYLSVGGVNGRGKFVSVEDPALNYKEFNLGYANTGSFASWWCRQPIKQYQQGLRKNQMLWKTSVPGTAPEEPFSLTKPYIYMLENSYPALELCQEMLKQPQVGAIAFHKDFAVSWDEIHGAYIIEYRAKRIGSSVGTDIKKYKLIPDYQYLTETLREVIPDVPW